jgi:hypothetical protein
MQLLLFQKFAMQSKYEQMSACLPGSRRDCRSALRRRSSAGAQIEGPAVFGWRDGIIGAPAARGVGWR